MQTKQDFVTETEVRSSIVRNTLFLVGNSVVFAWVTQIVFVIAPIIVVEATGSVALGGLATALVLSGDMPSNLYAGRLADTIGRKKTLLIGSILGFIGLLAMALSRLLLELPLFWAGLFVFALGTGFFVMNRTAMADMYPRNRGQGLGYLNTGNFVGSITAPVLIAGLTGLAVLAGIDYYDILVLACLPISVFAGILIALIRREPKLIAHFLDTSTSGSTEIHNSRRVSWVSGMHGKRDLLLLFIISSLSVGGVSIVLSLCPILLHSVGTEIGLISFSIALISVGTGGLAIILGKLADKFGRRKCIFFGAIIMGIGLVLLPFTQNYVLISVASFLVGLGGGAIAIASTALICDMVAPNNRGKVLGTNSFVINIFTFSLPPLAGILLTSSGPFSVSTLGAIVAAVVVLSMILVSRRPVQGQPNCE